MTKKQKPALERHTSRKAGKEDQMTAKKKAKQVQTEITENAHQIWLAGLGAVATAQEEGSKVFKGLVKKGQEFEKAGKNRVEQAKGAVTGVKVVAESYWETLERTLDEKVTGVIHRMGVPTKEEIDILTERVENLTAAIDNLRVTETPKPRTGTTTAKPVAKKATGAKKPAAKKATAVKTPAAVTTPEAK